MNGLNARLLAAHAAQDKAALVALYTEAADTATEVNARCFFLTHAYVFALDLGHAEVPTLRARLVREGRECQ